MGKLNDLTGQIFGYWTVLNKNDSDTKKYGRAYWNCICRCGTLKSVNGKNLRNGCSLSCGCLKKENQKFIDITNKRFGRLTVVSKAANIGNKAAWNCLCDCGNKIVVIGSSLRNGSTKSCGCIRKDYSDLSGQRIGHIKILNRTDDKISKNNKRFIRYNCLCDCGKEIVKYYSALRKNINNENFSCGCTNRNVNNYKMENNYFIGYTSKNKPFYFDLEDYDLVKEFYWNIDKNGYVVSKKNRKYVKMHRLLLNAKENEEVDHINHNTTDNRKCNLRIVNHSQNMQNKTPINGLNTNGIYFEQDTQKWRVYITKDKKRIYIGRYINLEDAIKARHIAENEYFGEYSYSSSIKYSKEFQIEN